MKFRNKFCVSSIGRWQLKWWSACKGSRNNEIPQTTCWTPLVSWGCTEFVWVHGRNELVKVAKYSLLSRMGAFSIFNHVQLCSWTCTLWRENRPPSCPRKSDVGGAFPKKSLWLCRAMQVSMLVSCPVCFKKRMREGSNYSLFLYFCIIKRHNTHYVFHMLAKHHTNIIDDELFIHKS